MDRSNGEDARTKPLISSLKPKRAGVEESESSKDGNFDDESQRLLQPKNCGILKDVAKIERKVQWNDSNGNKLAEVVEFQLSDVSDTDDDVSDSCSCAVM
ncbi:hypothetical protein RND81_12G136200 [Saponaria officinalis]|uniref:Uncharacterized protein n=1 Tax=Saponaria officinalis TaxID=3572 RepID=A0AAW1HAC3_SAPOF